MTIAYHTYQCNVVSRHQTQSIHQHKQLYQLCAFFCFQPQVMCHCLLINLLLGWLTLYIIKSKKCATLTSLLLIFTQIFIGFFPHIMYLLTCVITFHSIYFITLYIWSPQKCAFFIFSATFMFVDYLCLFVESDFVESPDWKKSATHSAHVHSHIAQTVCAVTLFTLYNCQLFIILCHNTMFQITINSRFFSFFIM